MSAAEESQAASAAQVLEELVPAIAVEELVGGAGSGDAWVRFAHLRTGSVTSGKSPPEAGCSRCSASMVLSSMGDSSKGIGIWQGQSARWSRHVPDISG